MISSKEDRWKLYKKKLLRHIGFKCINYDLLTDYLLDTIFEWTITMDYNRAVDAYVLRERLDFRDNEDATVLEVLCALAVRMSDEYVDDDPSDIFWDLLTNLGLHEFKNDNFYGREEEIDDILYSWLSRNFKSNGTGSIFPVHNPIRDQRDIEIWKQMQEYITEYY